MSDSSKLFRCPYLGLTEDRGMYCLFPNEAHRCYRNGGAKPIDWEMQVTFCMAEGYAECRTYRSPAPERPGKRKRGSFPAFVAGAAIVLLAGLAVFAEIDGRIWGSEPAVSDPAGVDVPPATEPSAPTTVPSVVLPISMGTEPTAMATSTRAAGTPSPTVSVTPTSTLSARSRVHVVAAGQTLSGIAAQYQTTVEAIMRANDLADRGYIFSGQRLVIP